MTHNERWLIGVEAQNFKNVVFDTQDISTIRGASLLCLHAIREIDSNFRNSGLQKELKICSVTLGASSGIWEARSDPERIKKHIRSILDSTDFGFLHLCFAIEAEPADGDFLASKARLSARLARRQLNAQSAPYPFGKNGGIVCPIDFVRPVPAGDITTVKSPDGDRNVSRASFDRRKYGVAQKQSLVDELLDGKSNSHEDKRDNKYALMLASIAETVTDQPTLKRNLDGKIAVIHIDGNSFGVAQKDFIEPHKDDWDSALEAQKKFDVTLQNMRKAMITEVIKIVDERCAVGTPSEEEREVRKAANLSRDDVVRFETLLWGGDEMTIIVPARLGWEIAGTMMAQVKDNWKLDGKLDLTASIAMVYCSKSAPIARIRELADKLCNHIKRTENDFFGNHRNGRTENLIFPIVLESFDHIGEGLDDYLVKRTPDSGEKECTKTNAYFILTASELAALQQLATDFSNNEPLLSRRQLRNLASACARPIEGQKDFQFYHDKLTTVLQGRVEALDKVRVNERDGRAFLLLEEYWDYLLPLEAEMGAV